MIENVVFKILKLSNKTMFFQKKKTFKKMYIQNKKSTDC